MKEWWRGAVIYQIYPRSFADSNGDGVGDLRGATEKLDHIAQLGADGVWLSPVFASPMKDFGYDVSDYRAIDPLFGTMADFDAFLARAHGLGLKVIIDQVYSHSSDEHAWFSESRASRDNPKADWYVWADAKPDGSPPNNWQSLFGGPSWEWDTRRRQYYMHNFLREQPDLNLHNPEVQDALLGVARYWLDKGVDGFRLDVINFLMHDPLLRDNPSRGFPPDAPPKHPYEFQRHEFDRTQTGTLAFVSRLRALIESYPDRFCVGEIEDEDGASVQLEYAQPPDRLHTTYSFTLLRARKPNALTFNEATQPWQNSRAWPSWSLSNHDVPRFPTRLAQDDPRLTRVLMAALLCLRGTIFLYQGDELGLPQADIPFEALRDPEAIRFWPEGIGRDGARTPMPWTATGGFSSNARPWLPLDPRHLAMSAASQAAEGFMLSFTRRLIELRKSSRAFRLGDSIALGAEDSILAFERATDGERMICAFNFTDRESKFTDARLVGATMLDSGLAASVSSDTAILPPYGGLIAKAQN